MYLRSLFLLPLSYVAKGNRIDREEVRAQLQKFQHAKVDRPAVPPYVTRFAASATSKQKEEKRKKKEERNTRNVFFLCGDKSSVSSLDSDEPPGGLQRTARQGKLLLFSTQRGNCRQSFLMRVGENKIANDALDSRTSGQFIIREHFRLRVAHNS